jgi:small subunit ribosomal protein S1
MRHVGERAAARAQPFFRGETSPLAALRFLIYIAEPMSTEDRDSSGSESFAALFEADQKAKPRRSQARGYAPGESVEGTVVRVGRDSVFVELDGKREGWLDVVELRDDDGIVSVKVGDVLRAIVVARDDDGGAIKLGRSAPRGQGAEGMMRAKEAGLAVEGLVTGVNKGGLDVQVDGTRAFCPASQADARFVGDLQALVGQRLKFLVTQIKEGGREVTLSRRALLEREAAEAREKIVDKLVAGSVMRGRVVSTRDFGAFVDLGGVEGLLPASELSHDRSLRPDDVVKLGDELDVQILKVEPPPEGKKVPKISLSLKALAGDPWESLAVNEGEVRDGRVMRLAPFGAFVQLSPGLDGLLHVSELSGELDAKGNPILPTVGTSIRVKILKIDREQRRIGLAPADEPTAAKKRATSALVQGALVAGKVSRIEPFGVFVQIEGTNARGLLPAQELQRLKSGDLHKSFPIGTAVQAKIVSIDSAGKIRLSIAAMKDDEERATFEDYRAKSNEATKGLGALGQKLQAAGLLGGKQKQAAQKRK